MTDVMPGHAAYEQWTPAMESNGFYCRPFHELGNVEQMAWRDVEAAQQPEPAPEPADLADDFYFERKQVIELRAVLGEIFTCLSAGDPALLDEEQVAEWRERSGMEEA